MAMSVRKISCDEIARAAKMFANGETVAAVAKELEISCYRARTLRKRQIVAQAVDRMRMTDVIPSQLDTILNALSAFTAAATAMESRLVVIESEIRKVKKAMSRLQVENKELRQTRRDAKRELRQARAELWKARGY